MCRQATETSSATQTQDLPREAPESLQQMGVKRACSPALSPSKLRRVGAAERDSCMYECSRYVWREKRNVCHTKPDRKFSSKRMALLYIAKKNSDSVKAWLEESNQEWGNVSSDKGVYALTPNAPFDLDSFLELSDEALEKYGCDVGSIMSVRKAPQGSIYRFQPVALATTSVDDLCKILAA